MNGRGGSHHLQVNGGLKSSQNPASCQISDLCCLSWTFFNEKNHRRMAWNWSLPTFGTKHLMWFYGCRQYGNCKRRFLIFVIYFSINFGFPHPPPGNVSGKWRFMSGFPTKHRYSWWSLLRGHTQDKQTKHNTGIHPFAHWIFFIKTDYWCCPVWTLKWPWVEAIDFAEKPFSKHPSFLRVFFQKYFGCILN